jgi:hypothetical protein
VVVEAVSGFVEAFPLKTKDAESVAGVLLHCFVDMQLQED